MEPQNICINVTKEMEKSELVIRQVCKVNELEVKPPVKLNIEGVIGCVAEFLSKRYNQEDQINQKRCHVLVDRDDISIQLVIHEHDEYFRGTVTGKMVFHPKFLEFGINTGTVWTPTELGMFFKMNRAFFPDKAENMRLVSDLMNFTATVNNSIDRSAKESGDRTDKFEQTVNSNLPKVFTLKVPIFKGLQAETIEIETFAKINGREVSFVLLSPAANQTTEDLRDRVIDEQIQTIRELCPDIAIIEK